MFNLANKVASAASDVASNLHVPGTTKKDTSFSVTEALKHVKVFTDMASHPAASADQSPLLQYIFHESQIIKETAHEDVDVEVEFFPPKSGDLDMKNIVVKVLPKGVIDAVENAVLVSAHIDTVFSSEGAGDDSSNVAVMLELARGISHSTTGFRNSVIFFFNTGEEDQGLVHSHSFINQNRLPFAKNVSIAIDLDKSATGANGLKHPTISFFNKGKEGGAGIFQEKHILDLEAFSNYPKGKKIIAQDLFSSGVIKSTTDFPVFTGATSGTVYHIKNDNLEAQKANTIQHLGENMLPFLLLGSSG